MFMNCISRIVINYRLLYCFFFFLSPFSITLFLEDTQLELRLAQGENVQLKKQFYDSHQLFMEKTSELERQLQSLEQHSPNNVPKAAQVKSTK